MASFSIHLAIGKRYLEKNAGKISDEKGFYRGIIAPDLTNNKIVTHYSLPYGSVWQKNVEGKVFLPTYLSSGKYDGSDYERGVFLHLVTDYIFFSYLIDRDYLSSVTYLEFCNDLYYSYDLTQPVLDEKYNIDYSDIKDEIQQNIADGIKNKRVDFEDSNHKDILSLDRLYNFIEVLSDIDIEGYIEKIKKAGINVLPDNIETI